MIMLPANQVTKQLINGQLTRQLTLLLAAVQSYETVPCCHREPLDPYHE